MSNTRPNLTNEQKYEIVADYIRLGSYNAVAKEHGLGGHETVRYIVNKFKDKHPEEYLKIQDTFLMEQKQKLLMTSSRTTQKALDKVEELIDTAESVKDVAITYGILSEKDRLMRGESTSNQAIQINLSGLEELAKWI